METIITTATVLAMYFNVATSNNNGDYCYNASVENNKVMNMEVLSKEGNYLSQKLQYRFSYDDQNRLASKEALKWNTVKQQLENYYMLDYVYTDSGYSVEHRAWNSKKNNYELADEKMDYVMVNTNIMAVNYYKASESNNGMELLSNVLVMNPQSDVLLTMTDKMEKK